MIKNIVIDCDGCLTDGRKIINADGERQLIAFHSRDNEAATRLIAAGYRVIVVTAARFPGVRKYWNRYGVEVFYSREKATLDTEAGFSWAETLGIGDDLMDEDFMAKCAIAFTPRDGHPYLRRHYKNLETSGGAGILAEVWAMLEWRDVMIINLNGQHDTTY